MNTKVAVGPTTVLGAGVSTSAFIAAVLAFLFGDRSEATVGTIVGGAVGALILAITLAGRYAQAKALTVPPVVPFAGTGITQVTVTPADEIPGRTEGVKAEGFAAPGEVGSDV